MKNHSQNNKGDGRSVSDNSKRSHRLQRKFAEQQSRPAHDNRERQQQFCLSCGQPFRFIQRVIFFLTHFSETILLDLIFVGLSYPAPIDPISFFFTDHSQFSTTFLHRSFPVQHNFSAQIIPSPARPGNGRCRIHQSVSAHP